MDFYSITKLMSENGNLLLVLGAAAVAWGYRGKLLPLLKGAAAKVVPSSSIDPSEPTEEQLFAAASLLHKHAEAVGAEDVAETLCKQILPLCVRHKEVRSVSPMFPVNLPPGWVARTLDDETVEVIPPASDRVNDEQ